MQYRVLGRTGITVSRLCFGALTIGPLQANLPLAEGAGVIRKALEAGVNFIDTAELYGTYPYIREALRDFGREVVVVSKCYAYTGQGMRESVEKALKLIGRDYIDVFMLHEQESLLTIKGHWEAIEYLLEAREKGLVRAIGVSTHHVQGVLGAAAVPEIDVIHPLLNMAGIGIRGGTAQDMLQAIRKAFNAGKGIYAMKALGGGHLLSRSEEALNYILSIPELASVAVGMSSRDEVDYNTRLFSGQTVPSSLEAKVARRPRRLCIEEWCPGCGECVKRCTSGAISLSGGKAVADMAKCTLCGYCGSVCPEFCIKVI
ncbi:aldo/keto reductase [Pelotomaculum terephthalicicum JT]|uniref:aldo/keto reductase n=1 Tax=Pelotomaculum TaxID=191373 RepID=UPI0009C85C94|nr:MULTISPECIES: aldo/keto reductase [Pelotomaculum]MCG9969079.1 aldo/keto reductase [Pelotomaculum terephthalicicum JT]OPX87401.1 MAG: General stress protein 69 [Pelotomaculum sp. PtaB.Bin117]